MTLKTLCENILGETGWPVPSTFAANTDATARQIVALANTELRALSERFKWPHLRTEYEFNTVVDQATYAWPDDFGALAWETVFDTEQYYRIRGSVPLAQWQRWQHGLEGQLSHHRFLQGYSSAGAAQITFAPAPSSVRAFTAFYYSNEYARGDDGASKAGYSADTDTSKVPERLIELGVKWRFRRVKGLDFSAELAEYNADVPAQFAKYVAQGDIPIGGRPVENELTDGYVPDNGFGA